MKIKNVELEAVAVSKKNYPKQPLPEFAFVGRSNVGKSSFINAMIHRKNLARTSSAPGKTQTINFYNVNENLRLVDLPGYGYAKVSKSKRDTWREIIGEYLADREELLEIFLLVDIRHAPSELDRQMYEYILQSGFSGLVVATKSDKIKRSQLAKQISLIQQTLHIDDRDYIIPFSSEKKDMVDEMWFILKDMMAFYGEESQEPSNDVEEQ